MAATALAPARAPVAVVNPRQVRDFAKATGRLAQTERRDAESLAAFAQALKLAPRPLPEAQTRELEAGLRRRTQLMEMLVAEKNRLLVATPRIKRQIKAHIAWLEKQLSGSDAELTRALEQSPAWQATLDLLKDLEGVGLQTRAWRIAGIPELGRLARRRIAARSLGSHRLTATRDATGASAVATAGGHRYGPHATWRP